MKYSEGILGMFIMLLAGIPLYMCATASVPIAVMLVANISKYYLLNFAFVNMVGPPMTSFHKRFQPTWIQCP